MTEDWVLLARVRRERGIRGEVTAATFGSQPDRFQPGLNVELTLPGGRKAAVVQSVWFHNRELVLKFEGIETRTQAETLRGADVCVRAEERPPAPEGEYYLSDLVGCRVETPEGRVLGEVKAWHDYGAAPLLEVHDAERELLVPFAAAFYRVVDLEGRRIVVELPEGLEEANAK